MNTSLCPECHRPVPQNAPDGICPDCLLVQGLGHSRDSGAFAVTTPQGGRPVVPAAADIARYFPQLDVLELLGQGGMGAVYKARQTKLDRMVAVKIIRPETTGDPAFAERFMREARTLARLNHSGIVAVHDFGEIAAPELAAASSSQQSPSTLFYFIMEYVDGANLRQLMQAGQLSPELAVNIVPQICEALQFAHDEGVVHRDIKPENILLDSRGRVKIADFGLARIVGHTTDDWTLTGTHQVMGTPRYMAPEQLAGSRTIDHRADIYSLGVVFYEMLTGTIPVGHFAPPSHKSKVDVRLDEVVLRAMASEPERRFQAARDLRSSVEQISSSSLKPSAGARPAVHSSHETGFSTIIDREVLGAWRLVSGNSGHAAEQSGAFPAMLMLLLCVIGGLGTFLPWFHVTFVKNPAPAAVASGVARISDHDVYRLCQDVAAAAEAPGFEGISWNPDDLFQCSGIDLKTGILAAVVFGSLGVLLLLIPNRSQISVPANAAAALLAMLALLATLAARIEIQNLHFQLPDVRSASDVSASLAASQQQEQSEYEFCVLQEEAPSAVRQNPLGNYRQHIGLNPGYFISLGMASALLILTGAGLRRSIFGEVTHADQEVSRTDIAAAALTDVVEGRLPDLCMVCGQHTTDRVTKTIQYQSKRAQAAMMMGFLLGGIPGVAIAILTSHETPVACPLCNRHRKHWSRLTLFASIGWLIPILAGGLGVLIGYLASNSGQAGPGPNNTAVIAGVLGSLLGLGTYLIPVIYMANTQVKCEQKSDDLITFSRVSSAFARATRNPRG